jgi:hypothetical protein
MGFNAELLGHAAAIERRLWEKLDQSAAGADSISFRNWRFVEEHLANNAWSTRGA